MRRNSPLLLVVLGVAVLVNYSDAFRCGHIPLAAEGRVASAAVRAKSPALSSNFPTESGQIQIMKLRPLSAASRNSCSSGSGRSRSRRQRLLASIMNPLHTSRTLSAKKASSASTSTTTTTTTTLRGGAAILATASTPALSVWLGPALACALAYALYNLFIKKASSSIDPILGGVLLQIVAAMLGALLLGAKQMTAAYSAGAGAAAPPLQWTKVGVSWAIAAGTAVGMAEILSFIISSLGVPASKSIPTIIGGSVVIGTLLGAAWLGERLTVKGWTGIVMIAIGIALVGMDPGSSASMH